MPKQPLVADITHVALAFMRSDLFIKNDVSEWPLFTTVNTVRSQLTRATAVMVAIGGWGDTEGFSKAAATEHGRERFARNVKAMLSATGADGMGPSAVLDMRTDR